MDSETRWNGYKFIERPDFIIPHKWYSGDLPIEVIINDINYIKSDIDKYDDHLGSFGKVLGEVIKKKLKMIITFVSITILNLII